jgi:hypothetical protein
MSAKRIPGRVRWRRFAIVMLPAMAIAGLLVGLTAEGAIGASISVSGQEFLVTADELDGTGFQQYPGQVAVDGGGGSKTTVPVIISAIRNATLTNLCQSVSVAGLTLRLTAGGGATPVSASDLVVDAATVSGNARFQNIAIGTDAGRGKFGEQAGNVTITHLRQDTWLTSAGTFTLPGLSLGFGATCLGRRGRPALGRPLFHQFELTRSSDCSDSPAACAGTAGVSVLAFSASAVAVE